jgi:hypothetical protein
MNDFEKTWAKLVAAARQAPGAGPEAAPFGFSTRVAALAFTAERAGPSLFARLSWRAAAAACLLAVVAVAVNFSAITGAFDESATVAAGDDPVSDVVDFGS